MFYEFFTYDIQFLLFLEIFMWATDYGVKTLKSESRDGAAPERVSLNATAWKPGRRNKCRASKCNEAEPPRQLVVRGSKYSVIELKANPRWKANEVMESTIESISRQEKQQTIFWQYRVTWNCHSERLRQRGELQKRRWAATRRCFRDVRNFSKSNMGTRSSGHSLLSTSSASKWLL